MLEQLKQQVCHANLDLVKHGLVTLTWGNVSGISDDRQHVVIKPSGVSYELMRPEQMVVIDLAGNVVEGDMRPSSGFDRFFGTIQKAGSFFAPLSMQRNATPIEPPAGFYYTDAISAEAVAYLLDTGGLS